MEVRASSLGRIIECPASMKSTSSPLTDQSGEAATIGTVVHKALARWAEGKPTDAGALARDYDLDESTVSSLFHQGRHLLKPYLDGLVVDDTESAYEIQQGNVTLTGHPDLVAHLKDSVNYVIWDWKTSTPGDGRYKWQVKAYWALVAPTLPNPPDTSMGVIGWIRNGLLDKFTLDEHTIEQVWDRLGWARRNINQYNPSADTCAYCPRRHECEAHANHISHAVKSLTGTEDTLTEYSPEKLAEIYPLYKAVKDKLKDYKKALKTVLSEPENQALPLPGGGKITLEERERSSVKLREAWPLICQQFNIRTPEDVLALSDALSISKGKLVKKVGADADRGEKGQLREEFVQRLDDRGALDVSTYRTFVEEDQEDGEK